VECRGKRNAYDRTRSLDKKIIVKNSVVIPVSVPHLGDLITYGKITVAVHPPIGQSATLS
jgi:hypothetical protein